MNLYHVLLALEIFMVEIALGSKTGVVDKYVEILRVSYLLCQGIYISLIRKLGDDDLNIYGAGLCKLIGKVIDFFLSSSRDNQVVSLR